MGNEESEFRSASLLPAQTDRHAQGIGQTLGAEQAESETVRNDCFGVKPLKRVECRSLAGFSDFQWLDVALLLEVSATDRPGLCA